MKRLDKGQQSLKRAMVVPPAAAEKISSTSPSHQWPRGPRNELHQASLYGSTEQLLALLSDGSIDIDQRNPMGSTPLMAASFFGRSHIARIPCSTRGPTYQKWLVMVSLLCTFRLQKDTPP